MPDPHIDPRQRVLLPFLPAFSVRPLHPGRLSAGSSNVRLLKAAARWIELFKEANMLNKRMRTLLGVALLPFLATSLAAQQAAPKMDKTRAARAECFRQANAAAQSQVGMASANPAAAAEGNGIGADTYYACIRKAGLRR